MPDGARRSAERTSAERTSAERAVAERAAWDAEAGTRSLEEIAASEAGWADVVTRLLGELGPLQDRRVLDCGCGPGGLSLAAAARGARVVGFDLSAGMLAVADRRCDGRGTFVAADFAALPFPDASFDAACGMFVLHHVELAPAAVELARVLRPGARAVFLETWQRNPLIRLARRLRGRAGIAHHGTADERPLEPADLGTLWAAGFAVRVEHPAFMLARLLDNNVLRGRWRPASFLLRAVDVSLERLPPVRPWGYFAALVLTREAPLTG